MPFAEHFMLQGTFTSPAVLPGNINVNLGFVPTKIELINKGQVGNLMPRDLGTAGRNSRDIFRVVWNNDFGSAKTIVESFAASNSTTVYATNVTSILSNGIAVVDSHLASPNTNLLSASLGGGGTTINQNSNATFTTTSAHGLAIGDTIQISNNAKMTNIGGMIFTVVAVGSTTTFQVDLDTSNATAFPAAETAYVVRKVLVGPYYYPQRVNIINITAANPMVISTSQNHGLTVGQQVRLSIPAVWGMTQANGLTGIITAVTSATSSVAASITIGGIDSSAFSAWVFAPALKVPFTFAQVIPIGSGPSPTTFLPNVQFNFDTLEDATNNQSFQGFSVGTNLLATSSSSVIGVVAGDIFSWTAWRGDV